MSEVEVEKEIQDKGLDAPRTPVLVVEEQFHIFEGTCLTVCCLTLRNGFTVTGESACVSPEDFDMKMGQDIARSNARQKICALEGYLLKERLSK